MLSTLFYLFLVFLCTLFMVLSAVALVICYPFDKGRRVVHKLTYIMVRIFFFVPPMWRRKVIGLEYIDPDKSYVILINHNSMMDIPSLYALPLNFRWVSKREVYKIPFFGQYLFLHGDICINRGKASEAIGQLLREGRQWISHGASIAVFPEGTRSRDGEIHRFKAGAFVLAKEAGVEILPVVIHGTRTIFRPNGFFTWRNLITIQVLKPIPAEHVVAAQMHELMEETREAMSKVLDEIKSKK